MRKAAMSGNVSDNMIFNTKRLTHQLTTLGNIVAHMMANHHSPDGKIVCCMIYHAVPTAGIQTYEPN